MTANRYTKRSTGDEPEQPRPGLERPKQCEVTGCQSLFCGTNASGVELFKRGKADIFVEDEKGNPRGVCCTCYARIVNGAGHARLSGLTDAVGAVDPLKLRSHWDSLAQTEIAETAMRTRYGRDAS